MLHLLKQHALFANQIVLEPLSNACVSHVGNAQENSDMTEIVVVQLVGIEHQTARRLLTPLA